MLDIGLIGLGLTVIIFFVSFKGFKNEFFVQKYEFEIDKILINKEYYRLISSGFLHVSWTHLIFNVVTLLAFCGLLESSIGELYFLLIYFGSLLGGSLFSLYVHRMHGDYHAIGASGAVTGVVFSCIVLFPGLDITLLGLPLFIPAWFYSILYVLITIYGIKSGKGNIAHDAHLGGLIAGVFFAILIKPAMLHENLITILIVAIPSIFFSIYIVLNPNYLLIKQLDISKNTSEKNIDYLYNETKFNKEKEIDYILDKINKKGIQSLTKAEKKILDNFSKK